jgi:hypothetical protein
MSAALIQGLVQVLKGASAPTSTGAASAGTSVVVTDSTGVAQPPVVLTGNETPPWSFTTSAAPGGGNIAMSDLDTNGALVGPLVNSAFTAAAGTGPSGNNFLPSTGATFTPTSAAASANSLRKA